MGFGQQVEFNFAISADRRWNLIGATLSASLEGDFGLGHQSRNGDPPGAAWNATILVEDNPVHTCAGVIGECLHSLTPCLTAFSVLSWATTGRLRVAYETRGPSDGSTWSCDTKAEFVLTLNYDAPPPKPPPGYPPPLPPPPQPPQASLPYSNSSNATISAAMAAAAPSAAGLIGYISGGLIFLALLGFAFRVCYRFHTLHRRQSTLLHEARQEARKARNSKSLGGGTELVEVLPDQGAVYNGRLHDDLEHQILSLVDRVQTEAALARAEEATVRAALLGASAEEDTRLTVSVRQMVLGQPDEAALGLLHFMRVPNSFVFPSIEQGVTAIVGEFETNGTDVDRECLNYVLRERAGSSSKIFPNSPYPRDCDLTGLRADRLNEAREPMALADFVQHPHSTKAGLSAAHVLSLRLYTTAAFRSLNDPMRSMDPDGAPHPFPVTMKFITDAIKQLRAVGAKLGPAPLEFAFDDGEPCSPSSPRAAGLQAAGGPSYLWRGLRDVTVDSGILTEGGTELAPMSTTQELEVAVRYAIGSGAAAVCLLRLELTTFMQRGAELSYLSAFPSEAEVLYPPLTFLQPLGLRRLTTPDGIELTVLSVTPYIGS